MSRLKKISLTIGLILISILIFMTWYKINYSMDVAKSFEVVSQNPERDLLIATQGSDFKEAVVSDVITAFKDKPVYIKVIDVTKLSSVNIDDWDAVLLMHTWESWKPQANAKQFLDRQNDKSKVIVLTTSGEGTEKIKGIDAFTSASKKSDVPRLVSQIVRRINTMLYKK